MPSKNALITAKNLGELLAATRGAEEARIINPSLMLSDIHAGLVKQIWLAPRCSDSRKRAMKLVEEYENRFPEVIRVLGP